MDFFTVIIYRTSGYRSFPELTTINFCSELSLSYNNENDKALVIERSGFFLFAHVNEAFNKEIESLGEKEDFRDVANLSANSNFSWGVVIVFNKKESRLLIVNDPYGIYPVFYNNSGDEFIIGNDFDRLIREARNKMTISGPALYDYFLFNYTLKSRTLIKEISRLEGGSLLELTDGVLSAARIRDIVETFLNDESEIHPEDSADFLRKHITGNYDISIPGRFLLTGGFDSKVILSLLLSERINAEAITFGNNNSDDYIAASSITKQFNLEHRLIGMTKEFINSMDVKISEFLRSVPNAPMLDTLLYYQLVKECLKPSNLVTGIMGGEMIVGPVLISELITTRSAALLTSLPGNDELEKELGQNIKEARIFRLDLFEQNSKQYIASLSDYTRNSSARQNANVVRFLLNETYAKFFGTVFSVLFSKFNLVIPLVDLDFLRIVLNSEYSFIRKHPFSKAPLSHYSSRRLYPKLISKIYPPVLKTKMDRGYYLEDFMRWYKFPRPFWNYFHRHFIKRTIPAASDTVDYLKVLEKKGIELVSDSVIKKFQIFDDAKIDHLIMTVKSGSATPFQKQKLNQLLTIHFFFEKYGSQIVC